MKAQGCWDFEHAVILFWKGLLQLQETSLTRQVTQIRAFYFQHVGLNLACVECDKVAYKLKTFQ